MIHLNGPFYVGTILLLIVLYILDKINKDPPSAA